MNWAGLCVGLVLAGVVGPATSVAADATPRGVCEDEGVTVAYDVGSEDLGACVRVDDCYGHAFGQECVHLDHRVGGTSDPDDAGCGADAPTPASSASVPVTVGVCWGMTCVVRGDLVTVCAGDTTIP